MVLLGFNKHAEGKGALDNSSDMPAASFGSKIVDRQSGSVLDGFFLW